MAKELEAYASQSPLVIGLPRGGVPVAFEVAKALNAPLDVLMVRKVGAPGQPELAVAAVTEGDPPHLIQNRDIIAHLGVSDAYLESTAKDLLVSMEKRRVAMGAGNAPPDFKGRTVVLVDDGIATGATMKAAIAAIKAQGALHLCVAVPVAPRETIAEMQRLADNMVCLEIPDFFRAVGAHYLDFGQTSTEEVAQLLAESRGMD